MFSVSSVRIKNQLEEFLKTYTEIPGTSNDEFSSAFDLICNGLSHMDISYSMINNPDFLIIIKSLTDIMLLFKKNDMDPVNSINTNFKRFIILSQLSAKIKGIIVLEIQTDQSEISEVWKYAIDYKIEQYICDVYNSKIETFKSNYSEGTLQTIHEDFTSFLIDYVTFLSRLNGEVPLKSNIDILLKTGDEKTLLDEFDTVAILLYKTKRVFLMKKLTNFCIKNKCCFQKCALIMSMHKDFRTEACIVGYFVFQRICKQLELEEMHQTSKILSMFTIDHIYLIDDYNLNPEFDKLYEESGNLITFKPNKNIKLLPIHKIRKYLDILHVILNSLRTQLQYSPFPVILLSILSELVMTTALDKDITICLIELIIGFLNISKLPSNFLAISYGFKIYEELKTHHDLEYLSKHLCQHLSINLASPDAKLNLYLQDDLESFLKIEKCWINKSLIGSYFLVDINADCAMEDKALNNIHLALNENLLLSTQYTPINTKLMFPYSVSLHFSILMKNEDCFFNNLAILDNYLTIFFENNPQLFVDNEYVLTTTVRNYEKEYFLRTLLQHYEHISHCLPDDFFVKCWEYIFIPHKINGHSKNILLLCSPDNLTKIIGILKTKTMEIITESDEHFTNEHYLLFHQLWSDLLKMEFNRQKKKVRKDLVNHFCFILNRTFLFNSKKIQTENGLILLVQLLCSFLQISWINKPMLMNCSLKIMTFVEKYPCLSDVKLLIEAGELLIVLYKCPNNSIKPLLGVYVSTFSNFLKKCWSFIVDSNTSNIQLPIRKFYLPLHKLEICSNLFRENKTDFEMISQYLITDLIKIVATQNVVKEIFMRPFYNIIFNLMDICSLEEMKQLMFSIQGPSISILKNAYKEYQFLVRFNGRL